MEMRVDGLDEAIREAEVGCLAQSYDRTDDRTVSVLSRPRDVAASGSHSLEALPSLARAPDPVMTTTPLFDVDEVDQMRSHEYRLLAIVFGRAPTREVLARIAELKGDASPLGLAHIALAQAAATFDPDAISREFFDLFIGVGRGELLPYGSYYLSGFLHERPLARVRADLERLGIERVEDNREPEDHIAILCDVMAGLAVGRFGFEPGEDRAFFERHLKPWAARFFVDCETAQHARFYKAAGAVGRMFMELEAEAFAMDA
jgi:TorA maturation chaperone TorD